jgi:type II secretion system protein N
MPTANRRQSGSALPRPLIVIGVPCAGALLVMIFLIRGFPYDQLGDLIVHRIEQSHGIQLSFGEVGPTLQFAGPALEATDLRARFPDRPQQQIDRALIRPAWSFSWFTGDPALHVELDSPDGNAAGTVEWNGSTTWVGTIRDARAEQPPFSDWVPVGRLEGLLSAEVDVTVGEAGPEGVVDFEIADGSIKLPKMRASIPFENLVANVGLGGGAYVKLNTLTFEGPTATGSGGGKISQAEELKQAPIGFVFKLNIKPELIASMRGPGLKLDSEGVGNVTISGTVGKPKIR